MLGRLLIVEDEAVLRKHIARLFVREGYEVTTASTCAEALGALAHAHFATVVLDVMLPDGNGLDLLAVLSRDERPARAVVMTAFSSPENEVRAQRLNVYCVLRKPLDLHQLVGAVAGA